MLKKFFKKKSVDEAGADNGFDFDTQPELMGNSGDDSFEEPGSLPLTSEAHGVHTQQLSPSVNMVPFEWARPVVAEAMGKKVDREVFGKVALFLVLVFFAGVVLGGIFYYKSIKENSLSVRLSGAGSELSEFETVAENLALYKSYAEIPNSPPVYVQFYGVSFLAVRNGLLAGKLSYSQVLSGEIGSRVSRDGFAIETGRRLEDIEIAGVWTITGTVSPRAGGGADSNWAMDFARQAVALFERVGIKAYARVTPLAGGRTSGSPDVVATILLWK